MEKQIILPKCSKCGWLKHPAFRGAGLSNICGNPYCIEGLKVKPLSREEKLEKAIESLLPVAAKKSGLAIICGHCGIIFPPHNNDCPVRLAEDLLYSEEDDEN